METENKPKRMEYQRLNYIFFLVFVVVYAILHFSLVPDAMSNIPRFVGKTFGALILTTIVAWLCWFISFKRKIVGVIAFNLGISLLTGKYIYDFYQFYQHKQRLNNIVLAEQRMDQVLENTTDAREIDNAYQEFAKEVQRNVGDAADSVEGKERLFLLSMNELISQAMVVNAEWTEAFNDFDQTDFLDFNMLIIDAYVYERRRKVAQRFADKSKTYRTFLESAPDFMVEKLDEFDIQGKERQKAIEGFNASYLSDVEVLLPILNEYISYSEHFVEALNLLQNNHNAWTVIDGELDVQNQEFLDQYNALLDVMVAEEDKINMLIDNMDS